MVNLFLGMLLAVALRVLAEWSKEVSAQRSASIIKTRIRRRLCEHLFDLGPSFLERRNTSSLTATIVDGVESLEAYIGLYIPYMILCVVMPIFLFLGFALYVDLISALILIAFVPLVPISIAVFTNLEEWAVVRRAWDAYLELSTYFAESIQGMTMTTLKLFDQVDFRGRELHRRSEDLEGIVDYILIFMGLDSYIRRCRVGF